MKRRGNGEGSIFKRKDGRWSAQTTVTLPNGENKRVCITLKDHDAVKTRLHEIIEQEKRRIPYADKDWTVAEYLDYWMNAVQFSRICETTKASYNVTIKNLIKPTLGKHKLRSLSVHDVRNALNALENQGYSGRMRIEFLRILSSCLSCAMREELIYRNVAHIVEKPKHIPKETVIWTAKQAAHFLSVTKEHPQYIAFLLFLTYGLRRGEVLGLRWSDIDFENNLIYIIQQIDRINGTIMARRLKTANSLRELPLLPKVRAALLKHAIMHGVTPECSHDFKLSTKGTVVVSEVGTPLEPRNLARCFHNLSAKAGLPRIKIHALRHTAATILKDLNVPAKDAQMILGHANISTTLNIYQHATPETHRAAISAVEGLLTGNNEQAKDSNLDSSYIKKGRKNSC